MTPEQAKLKQKFRKHKGKQERSFIILAYMSTRLGIFRSGRIFNAIQTKLYENLMSTELDFSLYLFRMKFQEETKGSAVN